MTGREDVYQQAMNQGHSAAWDQLWERAAGFYRQALEEMPDSPLALTSLGLALFELQEYEEALRSYQKAAKLSPSDPLPIEKIAQIYERLGNIEPAQAAALRSAELYLRNREVNKALENWVRVTRLNPKNMQAHSRLALVYERLGRKLESVTEYLAIASLYQHAKDHEKALRAVNHALEIFPGSNEAHQALNLLNESRPLPLPSRPHGGTAPLRMAQVRQLEPPKEETSSPGPDPVSEARQKALTELAGFLFEGSDEEQKDLGSRRGLQAIMRGAGGQLPKPVDRNRIMLHLSQVVDLQTQGQNAQAAEELERAIESGLDHAAASYDLGLLFVQNERLEEALRSLQNAVKHPDYALASRLLLGQTYRKIDRLKDAAMEYLEALRLADSMVVPERYADDLRQLYDPLIEAQNHETDAELLNRICENVIGMLVQPDWQRHLKQAREQLPSQANGGPPIPLAEILLQSRSSQVVESLSTIHQLAGAGYLRSAMEEAFYALQFAPTYLPLHAYMGELLLRQEQMQEAINKFLTVAHAYNIRGEPRRAIDMYHRIIDLAPLDLNPRKQLIDQLIAHGRMDDALDEYIQLADVYYSLADLDMARKTYTEALRLAQQTKVDRSWRVKILHHMADIDLQSLDWRQALRIYEQIRTLQPDDEHARSSLIELNLRLSQEAQAVAELDSYISYLAGKNLQDHAVQFLEGYIKDDPDRASIRLRLADLYRKAGRTSDAVAQLDKAGELLIEAHDQASAIKVIEAILRLKPANANEYQQLLAKLKGGI